MIEIFVLVILSMLAGGGIVKQDGMKGLALAIGVISIFMILWFISHR